VLLSGASEKAHRQARQGASGPRTGLPVNTVCGIPQKIQF